jgi:hypothetical protein
LKQPWVGTRVRLALQVTRRSALDREATFTKAGVSS